MFIVVCIICFDRIAHYLRQDAYARRLHGQLEGSMASFARRHHGQLEREGSGPLSFPKWRRGAVGIVARFGEKLDTWKWGNGERTPLRLNVWGILLDIAHFKNAPGAARHVELRLLNSGGSAGAPRFHHIACTILPIRLASFP